MLIKKAFFLIILILIVVSVLGAQNSFPNTNFWSLDAGLGMSDALVDGIAFQFVIDPKLSITPASMVGVKLGLGYSFEDSNTYSNIFTIEALFYYRWNFLRLGNPNNTTNIFLQGGLGLVAAYRGKDNVFDDEKLTRGSAMADIAVGVTIPLSERWHIEPQLRTGYPHLGGFSVTAGYKFKLPQSSYNEVIKTIPPNEIVKRIMITSVEYIIFAGDIGRYNIGIDRDAQGLNELVLNSIAQFLKDNPDCVVRIDGHANPVTTNPSEAEELAMLSRQRSLAVADQLRQRGIADSQMAIIYHGGEKTVVPQSDTEHRNRNRRVELVLMQVETD